MMKLLVLFFALPLFAAAQTNFKGRIFDAKTKAAIPFTTVGLIIENIGTNADEEGSFQLLSNKVFKNDSLVFSCVGYQTIKLSIQNLKPTNSLLVELENYTVPLIEVVITNRKSFSVETLNDFRNCGNSFITTSGYMTQLAQHFELKEAFALLQKVKICRMSHGIVDPEKTIFRIRVYDIDPITKAPSTDLCTEIIEVKTAKQSVLVDLEKYNIIIPNKDFFVAIEWLKIPYNESKGKMKVSEKMVEHITYRPSIGWTNNESESMETWFLNYKNVWSLFHNFNSKTNIAIGATVKF